jgi:hypothetical protein
MTMTDFFTKCHILGEIYREDMEEFKDFIKVNDIAFPIAYLHVEDLALAQPDGMRYVEETWESLLAELNLKDIGFEDLENLLFSVEEEKLALLAGTAKGDISKDDLLSDLEFAGRFAANSGQAIVGDPSYLIDWDTSINDDDMSDKVIGEYSYTGVSATTIKNTFGTVGIHKAVAFSTGYGDGLYPVYVKLNEHGRVSMVVIDFEENIENDEDD